MATDTATAPAPSPAAAPAVEQAPPQAPSTGGVGKPAPRPINVADAQSAFRQAYGRQKEMEEGAVDDGGREAAPGSAAPERQSRPARPVEEAPARPTPAVRATNGRFLPRQQNTQVDTPTRPAVQEPPTSAPPAPAPPAKTPPVETPARATPGSRPTDAPPSSAPPEEESAPPPTQAPQAEASWDEELRTARWQRAFQAEPGLRRTVGRITANPSLSASQKASQLAAKLADGEKAADATEWRAQQLRDLRRQNPQAYIQQVEADEAEAEASEQLALRITDMIAEAYEVDANDPDFQEAGPREGDDRVEGLRRFVEFTASKSPVFQARLKQAISEQQTAYDKAVADLKAQHKLDLEAATERGRAQSRSPFGRNGAPPRSTGTGVLPVGQDNGPDGGPRHPAKAPTVASVRDAIGLGYQQREPS